MNNGFLLKTGSGEINHDRFLQIMEEIIFSAPVLPQKNIILDFREAFFPDDSMSALFDIAIGMAKYRLVLTGKIAHVPSRNSTQIQVAKNLEMVLALKGFNYRSFERLEEAQEWVLK